MTEEHRTLPAAEALLDVARARLIAYRQYDNLNAASNMRGINHRRCECGICIAVDKWMAEHNAYLALPAADVGDEGRSRDEAEGLREAIAYLEAKLDWRDYTAKRRNPRTGETFCPEKDEYTCEFTEGHHGPHYFRLPGSYEHTWGGDGTTYRNDSEGALLVRLRAALNARSAPVSDEPIAKQDASDAGLREALEKIAGGYGVPDSMLELPKGEFHAAFVGHLQAIARNALDAQKGEDL